MTSVLNKEPEAAEESGSERSAPPQRKAHQWVVQSLTVGPENTHTGDNSTGCI